MAIRKIFVHPGDILHFHYVHDVDEDLNMKSFREQNACFQHTWFLTQANSDTVEMDISLRPIITLKSGQKVIKNI